MLAFDVTLLLSIALLTSLAVPGSARAWFRALRTQIGAPQMRLGPRKSGATTRKIAAVRDVGGIVIWRFSISSFWPFKLV
jgi:hypothetical protein